MLPVSLLLFRTQLVNLLNNMKKYLFITVLFIPVLTYAFDLKNSTVGGVIAYVIELLNLLVPILVAGALVLFFWGLSRFVISAGNEAELKKGKNIRQILIGFNLAPKGGNYQRVKKLSAQSETVEVELVKLGESLTANTEPSMSKGRCRDLTART